MPSETGYASAAKKDESSKNTPKVFSGDDEAARPDWKFFVETYVRGMKKWYNLDDKELPVIIHTI